MKVKDYYELIELGKGIKKRFETIMDTASEFKSNNNYTISGFDVENIVKFTYGALKVINDQEV